MNNFKVYLSLSEEGIRPYLQNMIEKDFILAQNSNDCNLFLTDNQNNKSDTAINMLIANINEVPNFKDSYQNLIGFNHYVVYNENDFLVERVKQALLRHSALRKGCSDNDDYTGVRSIISMEKFTHASGINLPIIKSFEVKSSKERKLLAEAMEKFFEEIELVLGGMSSVLSQYAVEIQEELLMNAIWDANPKHEKEPRTVPVELNEDEFVKLEWAFNGKDFAISVRDKFGRLNPGIMEKYVRFIFKAGDPQTHVLDTKKVGAGLGMYMILQRANLLSVFISKGKLTDVGVVICLSKKRRAKSQPPKAIDIIHIDDEN